MKTRNGRIFLSKAIFTSISTGEKKEILLLTGINASYFFFFFLSKWLFQIINLSSLNPRIFLQCAISHLTFLFGGTHDIFLYRYKSELFIIFTVFNLQNWKLFSKRANMPTKSGIEEDISQPIRVFKHKALLHVIYFIPYEIIMWEKRNLQICMYLHTKKIRASTSENFNQIYIVT